MTRDSLAELPAPLTALGAVTTDDGRLQPVKAHGRVCDGESAEGREREQR